MVRAVDANDDRSPRMSFSNMTDCLGSPTQRVRCLDDRRDLGKAVSEPVVGPERRAIAVPLAEFRTVSRSPAAIVGAS